MKIIGIKNGNGRELPQQVYLMADSSVIRTNKPFFVPHFARSFNATPAIALHIGRLGKHIAARFAHRYCDSISPAVSVSAMGLQEPQVDEKSSALIHSFDGSLLLGDFSDTATGLDINEATVSTIIGSNELEPRSISSIDIDYREIISQLSVYYTLKMGDIIVIELDSGNTELKPGMTIEAQLNQTKQLVIRVK